VIAALDSNLLKPVFPALAIAMVLFAARRRGIALREGLGLKRPRLPVLTGWIVGWIAWIAVGEQIIRMFQLDPPQPWPESPPLVLVLRILAIGILGPCAEELVMRGLLFDRVRRTALGPFGAILVLSLFWTLFHYRYGPGTLALIFTDGVLLGLARHLGGSLWIPILLHILGNLFSISQSLSG